jgi:Flp pilus assembly protein TadG
MRLSSRIVSSVGGRLTIADSRSRKGVNRSGQAMVIIALALVALLGAMALCTDLGVFYFNYVQMQKAADIAVLAGANYLPDNPNEATATAAQIAENNGIAAAEIGSNSVAANDQSISMTVNRTVPYYFAKVLGLTSGVVSVSASAGPTYPPSTVNAPTPGSVPSGGDNNGNNGTYCASTASCGLVPMGLDANTAYTDGGQIVLQQGEVGAGNWDLLALGGVGGNNLRTNIADGYNGMISVGDWVTTEPGKKVGPVDQGISDRLTLAQTEYPNGTYSNHSGNDPRVLIMPVVNWQGQNGRSQVEVMSFATVWLDSASGGQVTVTFISQVIPNSFGSPSGSSAFGAKGTPILLR